MSRSESCRQNQTRSTCGPPVKRFRFIESTKHQSPITKYVWPAKLKRILAHNVPTRTCAMSRPPRRKLSRKIFRFEFMASLPDRTIIVRVSVVIVVVRWPGSYISPTGRHRHSERKILAITGPLDRTNNNQASEYRIVIM